MATSKKLFLFIFLVYALAHIPVASALNSAVTFAYALYKEGKIERASDLLKPLAEKGDAHAAYVMGLIELDLYSSTAGISYAVNWFVKSSQAGFAQADLALGNIYHNEWSASRAIKDYQSSKFYYAKALKAGVADAEQSLINLEKRYLAYTENFNHQKTTVNEAIPNSRQSVKNEITSNQNTGSRQSNILELNPVTTTEKLTSEELRAILYSPVPIQTVQIDRQFSREEPQTGTTRIWTPLSNITAYFMGIGSIGQLLSLLIVVFSIVFMLRLITKYASQITGKIKHRRQDSSDKNKENLSRLMPAAKSGDKFAQYSLGQLYENSFEPPESHRKANYWYQLSAEQGYALAQYKLSVNYLYGYGFPRNEGNAKKAVYWLNLAVEQNYVIALYELGRCYENGWGVKKDVNFALGLYSQASSSNYGKSEGAGDSAPQSEFDNSRNLVACPQCNQTIRIPGILPSSKIRCQACSQKFSLTTDKFGNRQVEKESSMNFTGEDSRVTTAHDAFDILGIHESSDSNEITKAYREKIARYHPDKIIHLGEEFQHIAEHKTKKFVSAFQLLRKQGFVV